MSIALLLYNCEESPMLSWLIIIIARQNWMVSVVRFYVVISVFTWIASFSVQAEMLDLTPEDKRAHEAEADLWLDTVFGHCLFVVSGETWGNHPAERQGEWRDLRPDYASTLIEPLNDPKQSAHPSAIIIDLNEERTSCWTQYSSLVPTYAGSKFVAVREALGEEDRLKSAYVDQGHGPQQVEVILVGEDRIPVIFYQATTAQGPFLTVVTIVQQTVPDFVYSD